MEYPRRGGLYYRRVNGERAGGAFSLALVVFLAWLALASGLGNKGEIQQIPKKSPNNEKVHRDE